MKRDLFPAHLIEKFSIVDWGYTEELTPHSLNHYHDWLERGDHGSLGYLSDHRKNKRSSLEEVFPAAKSALVFLFSYHPEKLAAEEFYQSDETNSLKVASYVTGFQGKDYHLVIGESLVALADHLQQTHQDLQYQMSLDIHPVLERDLAYRAGLGWFGKNSMLISKTHGSFVMIGSLILNQSLPVEKKSLESDHCGQCRACVVACPTEAIEEDSRTLVAEKCISTWTIEHFKEGPLAPAGMEEANGEFFGCDICQDVCPWNHRPVREGLEASDQKEFKEHNGLLLSEFLTPSIGDVVKNIEESSNRGFEKKFKETPLGRTGKKGLLKNLHFWKKP